jgi:hypothetical protein
MCIVWSQNALLPHLPAALKGGTPMVSGAELQSLQNAFFAAIEDEERSVITITGEPGLGKSRLLYEFENWMDLRPEKIRLFRGRARLETQHLPFGLLRDLFAFRFAIQDDDPLPDVWRKLEAGIAEFETKIFQNCLLPAAYHFIGELLGYDFSDSPVIRQAKDDLPIHTAMSPAEYF